MPINAERTTRKTLNLPKDLVRRVTTFRHRCEFKTEGQAYAALLEKGLEAFAASEPATKVPRRRS